MSEFDEWDEIATELADKVTIAVPVEVAPVDRAPSQKELEREAKRLASIAARRAESAFADELRKQREAEKMAEREKKAAEEAEIRRRNVIVKSKFEEERDEFITEFINRKREEDNKKGKKHRWYAKMGKMSEGEDEARTAALYEWKKLKGL